MSTIIVCEHDLPDNAKIEEFASIDTEAMGLIHRRDRLCLVQIMSKNNICYLIQIRANVKQAPNLMKVLKDKNIVKIFHYARFDVGLLYHTYGVMCNNIYCTKIASRLVRTYSDRHGLKEICRQLLQIELNKGEQSSDWGVDTLTDAQKNYASKDVLYLNDLRQKLNDVLIREKRMDIFEYCCQFLPVRIKLDQMGWEETDIFAHH